MAIGIIILFGIFCIVMKASSVMSPTWQGVAWLAVFGFIFTLCEILGPDDGEGPI